jgi:phage terminase small subunit
MGIANIFLHSYKNHYVDGIIFYNYLLNIKDITTMNNKSNIKKLTSKQQRFVEEYLVGLNATAAVRKAGYNTANPSEIGYQLLHKTSVQNAVKSRLDQLKERTNVTAEKVIAELARIAFMNIGDFDNKTLGEMTRDDLACIAEITRTFNTKGDIVEKIRFHDKISALGMLAKYLGLFSDKSEPDTKIILNIKKYEGKVKVLEEPQEMSYVKESADTSEDTSYMPELDAEMPRND